MTGPGQAGPQVVQDVTAADGFAYGVIGADLHVHASGLPLYLLANWQAEQPGDPDWLRELPSRMLSARRAVVPFTGRAGELAELRRWRDSGPGLAVRWLHSPGGQGKTRLAGRLAAESASAGWKAATAFQGSDADPPRPGSQDMRLAGAPGLLLIVDYADRWRLTNLTWLLKNALLHQARAAVRVLMLARTADAWPAVRRALDPYQASSSSQSLPALGQAAGERRIMFDAALSSFAAIYQLPAADVTGPPGPLDDPEFGLTLAVHMAALAAVDAHAAGLRPPPADAAGLSMYLLDREQLHWARLHADGAPAAETAYQTPPQVMNQAVFTAALAGSVSRAAGTALLRDLGLPRHEQVLQDHAVCYPPHDPGQDAVLEPLYPDRLAEDFIALTVPGHQADYPAQAWAPTTADAVLARRGGGRATAAWTPRAITFLASAAQRWPHLGQRYLNPLLRRDPQLAVDAGSAALSVIASLPGTTRPVLEAIEQHLPAEPDADLDVGTALVYQRLAEHRLSTANPAARARFLHKLASALSRAGMHEQALAAAQQEVELTRRLAEVNPLIHGYNLASALDNLGVVFSGLGQPEEALAASGQAEETRRVHDAQMDAFSVDPSVRAWRRLVSGEPGTGQASGVGPPAGSAAWWSALAKKARGVAWAATDEAAEYKRMLSGPESAARIRRFLERGGDTGREVALAKTLTNQAGYLWEQGHQEKALAAAQQAVGLLRRLSPAGSLEEQAVLPLALHNLGMILSGLGREDEGLAATGEAVEIWRRLARASPAAYEPSLALSLTNYSTHLPEQEALAAAEEAVQIRRRLAKANPAVHEPGLANSLTSLSMRLEEAGRQEEAVAAGTDAVAMWRRLASASATHEPGLANSLGVLGMRLAEAGRQEEALAALREAIEMQRPLARTSPVTQLGFAALLSTVAALLDDLDQPVQALAAAAEAADIQRRPARDSPAVAGPQLAGTLAFTADLLCRLDQPDEALTTTHEAVGTWRRAAQSDPSHRPGLVASLGSLSTQLFELGQFEKALTAIGEAVKLSPESAEVIATRAQVYQALGRYEDALEDLTQATRLDPELAWAVAERGETYQLMGRYEEAAADLTRAIQLDPELAWAIGTRGQVHQVTGRYEEAVADLTRAIQLDPELAWAVAERGETYRLMRRFEEAAADLTRAIELLPESAEAIGSRGQVYRATGRYDEAVADLTRAIQLDPELAWAMAERGETYRLTDRCDDAVADLTRAIQLNPEYEFALGTRGQVYRVTGRYEEAVADLTRAIELDPELAWAVAERGEAYRLMGRFEEAAADLTRAIELNSEIAEVVATRGQVYRATGRYDEAVADLTRAIELDPELAWAVAERGEAYRLMGRFEEAVADLTRAIELDPEFAGAVATRGQVYQALGRYEDAVADLTRAIELDPEFAGAVATRGEVYQALGRYEDALADRTRAIQLDPEIM